VARGALFGFAGVVAGAATWTAVGVAFEMQTFLVAIGAGLLIAWLVTLGGRRLTPGLQALIVLQTLAAVALGELVRLMVGLWQDGQPLGVLAAAELYLQNLDVLGSDLAFALLAGVVGAAGGIGWTHQRAETMRGGPAAAGTTPGVVHEGAASPLSATPSPSGEPSSPKPWARRGTQFLVVGAVLGGLYLAVAEAAVDGDEGNVTAETAGVPVFELQVRGLLERTRRLGVPVRRRPAVRPTPRYGDLPSVRHPAGCD
jgi:hypothetical protein